MPGPVASTEAAIAARHASANVGTLGCCVIFFISWLVWFSFRSVFSGSHFTCVLIGFDSVIFVTPWLQCSCLWKQPFAWRDGVVLGRPSRMPCSSWTCVALGSACFLQSCGTFVPCFSSPVVRFCSGSHFTCGLSGGGPVKNFRII